LLIFEPQEEGRETEDPELSRDWNQLDELAGV
jgi:hypothetical protein